MGYLKHGFASETRLTCGRVNSYDRPFSARTRGHKQIAKGDALRYPFDDRRFGVRYGMVRMAPWLAELTIAA